MKGFVVIFIMLFFCCFSLFAQREEILELATETQEDNWLTQIYSELESGKYPFGLQNRTKFSAPSDNFLTDFQLRQNDLHCNLNLFKEEGSEEQINFQLAFIPTSKNRAEIYFGSLRPAFGLGTVFRKSKAKTLFTIEKPAHPSSFSPFGTALTFRMNNLSTFVLASGQKRNASLKEDKINALSKTIHSEMPSVQEDIYAGGCEYRLEKSMLGFLAYAQNYNRDFADSLWNAKLPVYTFSAQTELENLILSAEGAFLNNDIACQISSKISYQNVSQELIYAYRQGKQLPVYSAKPYLLSSQGENQEIDWNGDFQPFPNTNISWSYALIRKNHSLKSPNWNSRSIIYLSYKLADTAINLQFTSLDREIVSAIDSSYITTLPVHYRLRGYILQELNQHLSCSILCRYNYEDKLNLHKNSFYWENAFRYSRNRFLLSTGVKSWQTVNTLVLPEMDDTNPSGTVFATSDDNLLFVTLQHKGKIVAWKTELRQSWLNGNRSLYFSVGI
ncbi:MAG: hypothetical protein ABFC98_04215 [Candidatus Cloacimonas sp.]